LNRDAITKKWWLNGMKKICQRERIVKETISREGRTEVHLKELEELWKQEEKVIQWLKEKGLI
jgi:hypothetical protein